MKKLALLIALMLALGAFALAEGATLRVRGSGTVTLEPDTATISFGVTKSMKDITRAQTIVNSTIGRIIEALKKMGVSDEDIQTNSISVYQDYNYASSGVTRDQEQHYVVENMVSVDVADIARVGEYIDVVFKAGANSFNGVSFSASNNSEAQLRSSELAIESARQKAEAMAKAAGKKLGDIVSIVDDSYGYFVMEEGLQEKAVSADGGFAGRVYAPSLQASASVTVEYELLPVE